jgi:hypothetical protein
MSDNPLEPLHLKDGAVRRLRLIAHCISASSYCSCSSALAVKHACHNQSSAVIVWLAAAQATVQHSVTEDVELR